MSDLALHTTIRQVLEKHGQEILSDLRLVYILSDYGAFDKLSNDHAISKDLQIGGYGQLLLDCLSSKDADWQSKTGGFINDFFTTHDNYDSAEVIYICDAIAYGLGMLPESSIRKSGGVPQPSSTSVSIDYAAELQKLQNEYLALLKSSIVVPSGNLFKKPSGYYPIDAQNKLYLLEKKIWMLGQELGHDLTSWCANEKQKVLAKYTFPIASQRWGLLFVIVAPTIAIIIIVANLISSQSAKDETAAFIKNISYADSLSQANEYMAAIDAYKLAGTSYTKSYKKAKYKKIAEEGTREASANLVNNFLNKVQPLYDNKDYYEALKLLNSMPKDVDLSFDEPLSKRLAAMRTDLAAKCEMLLSVEMDDIVKDISKSKGKPSNEILNRIDYLLTIFPSNYWLNFIKNKSTVQ